MSPDLNNRTRLREQLTVCVRSDDPNLLGLFNEVLREIGSQEVEILFVAQDHEESKSADIVVFDTDDLTIAASPGLDPASSANEQLFLLSRTALRDSAAPSGPEANIALLKPISRKTLQIFLEQAVARARIKKRASLPAADSLDSSDTRDLLQCFLQANLKLQEYDHDRSNFLARAVHDFRAPLMAAGGYCSILLQQEVGPLSESQMQLLERIQRSLRKVSRMASAMLDLSVGKHVTRGPNLKEASLESCVSWALHEIEPFSRSKLIDLNVQLPSPQETLCFDPEQMEQVLVNLLENACKFTPKGGLIEIRGDSYHLDLFSNQLVPYRGSSQAPDGSVNVYRVDVSDTGRGIALEYLDSIFEEYTSYGGPLDRSCGGLGLANCRMTLQGHGGRIWAENHRGGARLSFALPLGSLHTRKGIRAFSHSKLAERAAS